jgi:hypothetical protein
VKIKARFKHILPAALLVLSAAIFTNAQETQNNKQNARPQRGASSDVPATAPKADGTEYTYEFTQPKFYVRHIVIKHDSTGKGTIMFERLNEDVPVQEPLQLSTAATGRITALWDALQFLDSTADYQSSQQFPHLGTMRIGMQRGERKRVAEFNWTHNTSAAALIDEYRKAADQEIFVFDISVARENQPLNAPKLMEGLESLFKRNGLSDPKQLVPLLTDLSTDEHLPLIARNHALRIIKLIQK